MTPEQLETLRWFFDPATDTSNVKEVKKKLANVGWHSFEDVQASIEDEGILLDESRTRGQD